MYLNILKNNNIPRQSYISRSTLVLKAQLTKSTSKDCYPLTDNLTISKIIIIIRFSDNPQRFPDNHQSLYPILH